MMTPEKIKYIREWIRLHASQEHIEPPAWMIEQSLVDYYDGWHPTLACLTIAALAKENEELRAALSEFRELGEDVLGAFPGRSDLRQLIENANTLLGDSNG